MSLRSVRRSLVLVACGSFSPPTFLHLQLFYAAREARVCEEYSNVYGVCSPVHDAYGKKDLLPAQHRLRLCELALRDHPWITVDAWETEQADFTRTALVLPELKKNAIKRWSLNESSVDLCLICGADLFNSFFIPGVWKPEDVVAIQKCGMMIITREGNHLELNKAVEGAKLMESPHPPITRNNISSSLVRALLAEEKSARFLIDPLVEDYCIERAFWNCKPSFRYSQQQSTTSTESSRQGSTCAEDRGEGDGSSAKQKKIILLGDLSPLTLMHCRALEEVLEKALSGRCTWKSIKVTVINGAQDQQKQMDVHFGSFVDSIKFMTAAEFVETATSEEEDMHDTTAVVCDSDEHFVAQSEELRRVLSYSDAVEIVAMSKAVEEAENMSTVLEKVGRCQSIKVSPSRVVLDIPAQLVRQRLERGIKSEILLP